MSINPYVYRNPEAERKLKEATILLVKDVLATEADSNLQLAIEGLKSVLQLEPDCTDPVVFALLGTELARIDISQAPQYLKLALKYNEIHHTLDDNSELMYGIYEKLGYAEIKTKTKDQIDFALVTGYFKKALQYDYDEKLANLVARSEHVVETDAAQKKQQSVQIEEKKGGCFIATAVYGTEWAEEVLVLKRFRDNYLLSSRAGQYFVRIYYTLSPTCAKAISKHAEMRRLVRYLFVAPIVHMCKQIQKEK